ncbi:GNAT family N-acetyltransferase [Miniphocaeibacter massiliensis]|uniref:GNAT family N-acetyltransferase n=1 Tax=Miniphocaeibacter massiliensis TaxID=2041841 RepID=UPI000C080705|nr:GNAT family N-acetyltransferase [Miniphocaeibacter massiliensis]
MYKFYNKLNNDIKHIREEVFVKEQKFADEFDDVDQNCIHLLYFYENIPVGTARIFNSEENFEEYHIGRVAILKDYRKFGLGKKIILAVEEKAKELGAKKLVLSAQKPVEEFYKKCGYISVGEEYFDQWCPHIDMEKEI